MAPIPAPSTASARAHQARPGQLLLAADALDDGGQVVGVRPHLRQWEEQTAQQCRGQQCAPRCVESNSKARGRRPAVRVPPTLQPVGSQPPASKPAAGIAPAPPWPWRPAPFRAARPPARPPPAAANQGIPIHGWMECGPPLARVEETRGQHRGNARARPPLHKEQTALATQASTVSCAHLALLCEDAAAGIKGDARRHEARGHRVPRLGGKVGEDIHVRGGIHPPRHAALQVDKAEGGGRVGRGWAQLAGGMRAHPAGGTPAAQQQRLPTASPCSVLHHTALTCRQPLASSPTRDSCMFCMVTVSA